MGHIKHTTLALTGLLLIAPLAQAGTTYYATNHTPCSVASVSAGGVATVGYALDAVAAAIQAGQFKNSIDQTNLLTKVAAANSKAMLLKWADAIGKLDDITSAATALAAASKPKLDNAGPIGTAAYAAAQCMSY